MNIKYAAVPIVALAVSGCNPVDIISGKPSAFKAEVERRQALTIPEPSIMAPINLADAIVPAPVQVVVQQPECFGDVFRVHRCLDGRIHPWSY